MPDDANLPARYPDGRFGPGNNGRPTGSYNQASRRAALAILDHFERIQDEFLEELTNHRAVYVALLSKVLPRKIEIGVAGMEALTDDEVSLAFIQAHDSLSGQHEAREVLRNLEAHLLNRPGLKKWPGRR